VRVDSDIEHTFAVSAGNDFVWIWSIWLVISGTVWFLCSRSYIWLTIHKISVFPLILHDIGKRLVAGRCAMPDTMTEEPSSRESCMAERILPATGQGQLEIYM
jgi:hypothetical protein